MTKLFRQNKLRTIPKTRPQTSTINGKECQQLQLSNVRISADTGQTVSRSIECNEAISQTAARPVCLCVHVGISGSWKNHSKLSVPWNNRGVQRET